MSKFRNGTRALIGGLLKNTVGPVANTVVGVTLGLWDGAIAVKDSDAASMAAGKVKQIATKVKVAAVDNRAAKDLVKEAKDQDSQ